MSTTTSMMLGIAFLGLAIVAVVLQAWLWGPKYWNEESKRTEAPKLWLRLHAACGYTYGMIYLVMMWNMVPRLWEYQYELPARTVIHAVVAICIGVLLVSKISILLFFRHFEESMPRYGFGILLSTVILIFLSVPFSLRAHDIGGRATSEENLARVEHLLAEVEFGQGIDRASVISVAGLERGREILVSKCTSCHDMRTILIKPRTAHRWYDVSERMLDKPNPYGQQLLLEDIPYVSAYLVAITPDLQESMKRRREHERSQDEAKAALVASAVTPAVPEPSPEVPDEGSETDGGETDGEPEDAAPPTPKTPTIEIDDATGEAIMDQFCTDCHELDDVEAHGGDDAAGWRTVIGQMIDEGAEIDEENASKLAAFLARTYPK